MGGGFNGFEIAEQIIYSKDEYIEVITAQNSTLTAQVTDLQLALCDVYEATLSQWERRVKLMAKVYADLIKKGLKTLDDVPEQIRAEVEALLESEE